MKLFVNMKDTNSISSETIEKELVDEEIDKEIAETKASEMKANQMNNATPERESLTDNINNYISIIKNKIYNDLSKVSLDSIRPNTQTITDIKVEDQRIEFVTADENHRNFIIEKDSKKLANLVEYKNVSNVSNVSELQGEKIRYWKRFNDYNDYYIPRKISPVTRFLDILHKYSVRWVEFFGSLTSSNTIKSVVFFVGLMSVIMVALQYNIIGFTLLISIMPIFFIALSLLPVAYLHHKMDNKFYKV